MFCLTYRHSPKETSYTVIKPKRKGVMRIQSTEQCLKHCFWNANQVSANQKYTGDGQALWVECAKVCKGFGWFGVLFLSFKKL